MRQRWKEDRGWEAGKFHHEECGSNAEKDEKDEARGGTWLVLQVLVEMLSSRGPIASQLRAQNADDCVALHVLIMVPVPVSSVCRKRRRMMPVSVLRLAIAWA